MARIFCRKSLTQMWITGVIANFRSGQIAQLVEQRIENPCVGSSILPLATTNRILAVIFLSNAVYPNLQDPSPARLSAMFRACLVSTAVYPNCIEATEFWGYIWGYLRNTAEKIPPNAANRPPNQEYQACRQSL